MMPVAFALLLCLGALRIDGPDDHERGDIYGDKAVGCHGQDAASEKQDADPLQYFAKYSHSVGDDLRVQS